MTEEEIKRIFEAIKSVEVLELQPGDALVLKTDRRIDIEQAEFLKRMLEDKLPGRKVLVLGPELDIKILRSAEVDTSSEHV